MVKKYKVVMTPLAQKGLRDITAYLRRKESASVATKVRKGIMESVKSLETMPNAHALVPGLEDSKSVYRRILKWSYRIVFTVEEDQLMVLVVDVVHGAQDPQTLIDRIAK